MTTYYGVYRVSKNGSEHYVSRSCTSSEKLAREIAADLTAGRVIMPDGSEKRVPAQPHTYHEIKGDYDDQA